MAEEIIFEKILTEEKLVKASGKVLEKAEFFQDHFPDFPILPGVLAVEILKRTAEYGLKKQAENKSVALKSVRAVKFAKYLKPGDAWESEVSLLREEEDLSTWKGRLLKGGEQAVSARLELTLI